MRGGTAEALPGTRRLALIVDLHEKGFAALAAPGATGLPMNDERELGRSLERVVESVRGHMRGRREPA